MEAINDAQGRRIAWIDRQGRQTYIKDARGVNLGWYDSNDNMTKNASGINIGQGNQLMMLLR